MQKDRKIYLLLIEGLRLFLKTAAFIRTVDSFKLEANSFISEDMCYEHIKQLLASKQWTACLA